MAGTRKKSTKKTVKPGKNIVESMTEDFKKKILKIIQQGIKDLIIDLKGVETVDSTGLGIFIATHNSIDQEGGKLTIKNVSEDIYTLMKMIGLDRHINVIPV